MWRVDLLSMGLLSLLGILALMLLLRVLVLVGRVGRVMAEAGAGCGVRVGRRDAGGRGRLRGVVGGVWGV